MKNFWFAHFCTWIWKPPVISLLLFAGLAANIKCSLLLKLKNQGQTRILSAGSYPASVIDLPHNACYHIKSIRFFSFCIRLSRDYSLVIMRWIPTLQEPCTGCELPDPYSHTHRQRVNANTRALLMKQILFISIYQTYPILFSSTKSINSSLHILCK